jgi:2-hydroxychromene-2-carboxylate isomerase
VDADQPIFYYDLGSPDSYLVAETIMAALPVVPEWEPVFADALGHARGLAHDAESGELERVNRVNRVNRVDRGQIERRARELQLQPLRWPVVWPPDSREAMLAATYAKRVGRAVAFSLAAFRQTFAAGRDLGDGDTVLIAAAACEMHPTAVLKGIGLRSVVNALEEASQRALAAGVRSVPAIQVGAGVFEGERCVHDAAHALGVRA